MKFVAKVGNFTLTSSPPNLLETSRTVHILGQT